MYVVRVTSEAVLELNNIYIHAHMTYTNARARRTYTRILYRQFYAVLHSVAGHVLYGAVATATTTTTALAAAAAALTLI